MNRHLLSVILLFAAMLLLPSCTGTPTPARSGQPTSSSIVQKPIRTATPTPEEHIITPANAANVISIARLGKGVFYQAAMSPDGSTLAIASSIGIYFYNARTLDEQGLIETPVAIENIAYSPDGSLLATTTDTGIQLRDSYDGKVLRSLAEPLDQVNTILFSPDGQKVAAGNSSGAVKVWSTDTGKLLHTFTDIQDHIFALAFSRDGRLLAGGGYDDRLILWDTITGQVEQTFNDDSTFVVAAVAYSPDGHTLAWSNWGGLIQLWDVPNKRGIRTLHHPGGISSITFSADGQRLVSANGYQGEDKDATLIIWDIATGRPTVTMGGHAEGITGALLNPDGRTLFSIDERDVVRLWDTTNGQLLKTRGWTTIDGSAIAFSPDGESLVTAKPQRGLQLWDVKTHDLTRVFAEQAHDIIDVDFSHDGQTITSLSYDAVVHIWDAGESTLLRTFEIPGRIAAFSPDGRTLASAQVGGHDIWLIDRQTGQKFGVLTATQSSGIGIIEFSPQGQVLASASQSYFEPGIKIWDIEAKRLLHWLGGNSHSIDDMTFSPDGEILASSDQYGLVILQKTISEQIAPTQILYRLKGYGDIAFSPDGRIVVTSYADVIDLWEVSSGHRLAQLTGHTDGIRRIVFSLDGAIIATSSWDGTVRLWGVP